MAVFEKGSALLGLLPSDPNRSKQTLPPRSRLCAARVGVLTAHRLYLHRLYFPCCLATLVIMSATEAETQVATTTTATKKVKKLKPARKQVKPGEVEKKEAPQTGKEYSA